MSGTGYRKYRCKYWQLEETKQSFHHSSINPPPLLIPTPISLPLNLPPSVSPPAPPGHWFIQEPGQKWSERWASATSDEKNKYAFELANSEGGMDLMRTNFSRDVKAPEHWVHDDIV
ncbi:predicted protein [Sclerotinia sclerotiorum 1980 UF-70]|uniref:Uncharacterized protein n=1 Tax=Sclerotinia sclerotiorum (strain ATCC 18683 / 1980 / Ss-1) TaxID=665079 RepID=A7E503_SCLS1|nr:predicted protein [Sclerotinia sclerotiorum 1980 UF-70]EDN90975.1 predicted protein [Sclerotinia sclerotiorum 1980 UF-70]